jgi:NAD(P)-dependent dehydrogenase (short-subunit alcohol dehydrogenase family)
MPVSGRVILVTGAAWRTGGTIARRLADEGARVVIHYSVSEEEEARRISTECGNAPLYAADLENVAEIRSLFDRILNDQGRLDGLVNSAARSTSFDAFAIEEADWDFIYNINLKALFFCCQAAGRIMKDSDAGGRIVNIASLAGVTPWTDQVHYSASMAGVIMLTKGLARALAPHVTVNAVAPGYQGHADEIAAAVLSFLTAPDLLTGQILAVDGGLRLT